MSILEESQRLKDEEIRQRKKAEYERWFQRGKKATREEYLSMFRAMRHDSNAFTGFADGYDSKRKRSK